MLDNCAPGHRLLEISRLQRIIEDKYPGERPSTKHISHLSQFLKMNKPGFKERSELASANRKRSRVSVLAASEDSGFPNVDEASS
jgi:hypothetical protein